jgi:hypothetical protein
MPFTIPENVDGRRVTSSEATRLIMTRIAGLLPERYRGVYAQGAMPPAQNESGGQEFQDPTATVDRGE